MHPCFSDVVARRTYLVDNAFPIPFPTLLHINEHSITLNVFVMFFASVVNERVMRWYWLADTWHCILGSIRGICDTGIGIVATLAVYVLGGAISLTPSHEADLSHVFKGGGGIGQQEVQVQGLNEEAGEGGQQGEVQEGRNGHAAVVPGLQVLGHQEGQVEAEHGYEEVGQHLGGFVWFSSTAGGGIGGVSEKYRHDDFMIRSQACQPLPEVSDEEEGDA